MGFMKPEQIWERTVEAGVKKAQLRFRKQLLLGFLGGAYIALGFLLYIRVSGVFPAPWSDVGSIFGAAVFPLGLILTIIAGGELLTGNMMAVPTAFFTGKIKFHQLVNNWAVITVGNFLGAVFIAYVFGHLVGLTEQGVYLTKLVKIVHAKTAEPFSVALLSGIGCNWLVGLAVWLAYSTDNDIGRIIGIWFPTMAFVAIGFQHVVANMFVIPAAIFSNQATWMDFLRNVVPVYMGNVIGGALFVSGIYALVYRHAK
ncbi:putative formate transporter 1 [Paenibacillus allorhizoplanae]|uniref:Formate transporter 1 n=1 Tax=Paenibacillus allorhizoplanae TaxID=2905648 RepID=A0ABM9C3S6_9BACL|nr:formate/nitrite transporter family protein [Paenibacillus allorhizoplanae]CAH1202224.1 putative formate transporter 1 [Paenibacillus allorhizoplanae]